MARELRDHVSRVSLVYQDDRGLARSCVDGATAHDPERVGPDRFLQPRAPVMQVLLDGFRAIRPRYEIEQARSLAWLAAAPVEAEATRARLDSAGRERFRQRIEAALARCACRPSQIGKRGHSVPGLDDFEFDSNELYPVRQNPHGAGSRTRTRMYSELVDAYFAATYADESAPPSDLVHVTCTGYASPTGAQKLAAVRGWTTLRVTNAYQMGCYAALPALRIGAGLVAAGSPRIDIVHTELCSLHLDPSDHRLEQLVVQSLFADGLIRYTMRTDDGSPGLRVLALHEWIVPDSADAMTWIVSDAGMQMTLARDVPERIAGVLRTFMAELMGRAGLDVRHLAGCVFAVHPGGPRIVDGVRDVLELTDPQVAASRGVLRDFGNMSSATLPHIWQRLLADPRVPPGTLIPSLAFGPGLTVCGGLLQKQ